MDCSDLLVLQRRLDGELDEAEAELVAGHIESCAWCRAESKRLAELRAFVQEQLGMEDEGEEEKTAATLGEIARRVAPPGASPWWRRRMWLATAAAVVLALLVPLPFISDASASPSEILEESASRARMWMYQPNKILHWEVDTVSQGVKGTADGRWRTRFWRKNGVTSFSEIGRQTDPEGGVAYAVWRRADGSAVRFRGQDGFIEVSPTAAEMERALPTLSAELRRALETELQLRTITRSLDFHSRRDMDLLHGRSWVRNGNVRFRRGILDRWGEIRQITVEQSGPPSNPMIVGVVHEYDVESSTFRLLRLKSTITYADGTVGVHDSRWVAFREATPEEFDAQTPRDLLESGARLVHLTPRELATRRLQDLNRATSR